MNKPPSDLFSEFWLRMSLFWKQAYICTRQYLSRPRILQRAGLDAESFFGKAILGNWNGGTGRAKSGRRESQHKSVWGGWSSQHTTRLHRAGSFWGAMEPSSNHSQEGRGEHMFIGTCLPLVEGHPMGWLPHTSNLPLCECRLIL